MMGLPELLIIMAVKPKILLPKQRMHLSILMRLLDKKNLQKITFHPRHGSAS